MIDLVFFKKYWRLVLLDIRIGTSTGIGFGSWFLQKILDSYFQQVLVLVFFEGGGFFEQRTVVCFSDVKMAFISWWKLMFRCKVVDVR